MTLSVVSAAEENDGKTRLRLWLRLLKVSRAIEGQVRENLRTEFASTLPRFDVLAALHRFPSGMKMSELSGILKVSNGNVTGIVDRLVTDGSVIRSSVPGDRRAFRVCLTKRGQEEFLQQAEQHEKWIDELLAEISEGDAHEMMRMLDQVDTPANAEDSKK